MINLNLSLASAVVIFCWSCWCIFSPAIPDGVIGRFLLSVTAISAFAVIVGPRIDFVRVDGPEVILNACMAGLSIRHFVLKKFGPRIQAMAQRLRCQSCPENFGRRKHDGTL